MKTRGQAGFTLVELMVVVMIIGILAAFAIPQYLKSVETSKADDAVALANMIATTNRMYALDHGGTYTAGYFKNSCNTTSGTTCCPGAAGCTATPTDPCDLVQCKYLAAQDFDSKSYIAASDTPGANSICNTATMGTEACAGGCVSCVSRKTSTNCTTAGVSCATGVGSISPYTTWGYGVATTGSITSVGTNPPNAVIP